MTDPTALVPALRNAPPAEAAKVLRDLTLEQIKPVAREVLGMRKIHNHRDHEEQKDSLIAAIAKQLAAGQKLRPALPRLGDSITDEESGEAVRITTALQERALRISHELRQAEYSVQAGMVGICRVVKAFRDERLYLCLGFGSFARYCDSGHLQILGAAGAAAGPTT